jgi:dolichol kinase
MPYWAHGGLLVNHRHLLPNEIDLLVDGEGGFGLAPLRAHVRECATCRAEFDEARQIADGLEELPHFAPSVGLADRVMAQVPVFIPWHVAARDSLARWAPQARPLRVAALTIGTAVASVLTIATLWLITQGDLLALTAGLAGERIRALVGDASRELAAALFGEQFLVLLQQTGMIGAGLAALGFITAAAVAVMGLRALASSSRPRG